MISPMFGVVVGWASVGADGLSADCSTLSALVVVVGCGVSTSSGVCSMLVSGAAGVCAGAISLWVAGVEAGGGTTLVAEGTSSVVGSVSGSAATVVGVGVGEGTDGEGVGAGCVLAGAATEPVLVARHQQWGN